MRKNFLAIMIILLLLTACTTPNEPGSAESTDGPTATEPTAEPTAVVESPKPSPTEAITDTPSTVDEEATKEEMMPGCTITSIEPTEEPEEDSIFGPITEEDWVIGPATATVTLLEYSDFQ